MQILPIIEHGPEPLLQVMALKAFWRLGLTQVVAFAALGSVRIDPGTALCDALVSAVQGLLDVEVSAALDIVAQRLGANDLPSTWADDVLAVDEAGQLLEPSDARFMHQEQQDLRKCEAQAASFVQAFRQGRFDTRAEAEAQAPGRRRANAKVAPAQCALPNAITQASVKSYCPPGGSIWRSHTRQQCAGIFPRAAECPLGGHGWAARNRVCARCWASCGCNTLVSKGCRPHHALGAVCCRPTRRRYASLGGRLHASSTHTEVDCRRRCSTSHSHGAPTNQITTIRNITPGSHKRPPPPPQDLASCTVMVRVRVSVLSGLEQCHGGSACNRGRASRASCDMRWDCMRSDRAALVVGPRVRGASSSDPSGRPNTSMLAVWIHPSVEAQGFSRQVHICFGIDALWGNFVRPSRCAIAGGWDSVPAHIALCSRYPGARCTCACVGLSACVSRCWLKPPSRHRRSRLSGVTRRDCCGFCRWAWSRPSSGCICGPCQAMVRYMMLRTLPALSEHASPHLY